MPLAAKKGHNGRKTWVKGWDRMSITIPNLGHRNHVRNTWAPTIKDLNSRVWTTCGDRRMPWMKARMCCAAFLRRVGLFRDVADDGQMAGLPWGVGISGAKRRERRFRPALCGRAFLTFDSDASTLNTIQNDCSSVVNSFCAGSTCYLLYTLLSL